MSCWEGASELGEDRISVSPSSSWLAGDEGGREDDDERERERVVGEESLAAAVAAAGAANRKSSPPIGCMPSLVSSPRLALASRFLRLERETEPVRRNRVRRLTQRATAVYTSSSRSAGPQQQEGGFMGQTTTT